MSKLTVLNDSDLDAVNGGIVFSFSGHNFNKVVYSGNGGTAVSGVATGDNTSYSFFGGVSISNGGTGYASANGNVTINN